VPVDIERLATIAVDCGFKVHEGLGPGLLESVYEAALAYGLASRGLVVERQKPVPIRLEGVILDEAFRADLLVEGKLLIELKSVERTAPVHGKQVLTYLRLMDLPLGLLMNFGAATFREGVKRVANSRSSLRLGGPSAPPAASLRTGFA
jgi:GxxExxY protein